MRESAKLRALKAVSRLCASWCRLWCTLTSIAFCSARARMRPSLPSATPSSASLPPNCPISATAAASKAGVPGRVAPARKRAISLPDRVTLEGVATSAAASPSCEGMTGSFHTTTCAKVRWLLAMKPFRAQKPISAKGSCQASSTKHTQLSIIADTAASGIDRKEVRVRGSRKSAVMRARSLCVRAHSSALLSRGGVLSSPIGA
mmetsp:Transcript_14665/g.32312  ORF Transcript_14665/g.32312 Transcript_14665/m.32312 type:complete len:204 (-) Transcript_14665:890-1501(-)